MTHELLDATLNWIAANPGWMGLIVFLTSLAESLAIVGLIVPGAMLMFGFGALVALGHLEFWSVCGWAVLGAVAGDGLSFWLGRTFHQRLRQLWPFSRHPELLARSEAFFRRHGGKSVLFGRFFGPVRAVIPAVAGMLDMPAGRFLLVNVASALLWAPAFLLPGVVFAASLELASQVAWRLMVLILLLAGLLWITARLVRGLFRLLQPRINGWLRAFLVWSNDRPVVSLIGSSLLDPAQSELRGLSALAMLLLGAGTFLILLLDATGQRLPTGLDHGLYQFLQNLRTPWADNLMVLITELGDYPIKLTLALVVFGWLFWKRAHSAALHWLAALSLGTLTNIFFEWLARVPRPLAAQGGISRYSFPSDHVTLSTILFGFLAVLVAREIAPARRWIPYTAAALLIIPIAFSRLYLGVHWLSDTLAGLCLGLVWVSLLGLAYNRHPAPPVNWRGLLRVSLAAVGIAAPLHASLHHAGDLRRYQAQAIIHYMTKDEWWQDGWRRLPANRIDFRGRPQQALVFEWAAARQSLRQDLQASGWRPAPPLTAGNALIWLSPQARLADMPVLPRVHDGHHEDLSLIRPGKHPDTRWVLRFWDSGVRLRPGDIPLWLGSLSLQRLQRRIDFLSLTVDDPGARPPPVLLAATLHGRRSRTVVTPDHPGGVTLVAD